MPVETSLPLCHPGDLPAALLPLLAAGCCFVLHVNYQQNAHKAGILAEGAIALPVTLSGGALFAS